MLETHESADLSALDPSVLDLSALDPSLRAALTATLEMPVGMNDDYLHHASCSRVQPYHEALVVVPLANAWVRMGTCCDHLLSADTKEQADVLADLINAERSELTTVLGDLVELRAACGSLLMDERFAPLREQVESILSELAARRSAWVLGAGRESLRRMARERIEACRVLGGRLRSELESAGSAGALLLVAVDPTYRERDPYDGALRHVLGLNDYGWDGLADSLLGRDVLLLPGELAGLLVTSVEHVSWAPVDDAPAVLETAAVLLTDNPLSASDAITMARALV